LAERQGASRVVNRNFLLLNRSRLLRKLNRPAEAAADWCRAKDIPGRDALAKSTELDLSQFLNGSLAEGYGQENDLLMLPGGLQTFLGIEFDVRGMVTLSGREFGKHFPGFQFPPRVEAIPVTNCCRRVHFLHSAHMSVEEGTRIGAYVFHFASGRLVEWPIVFGETVHGFWWTPWRPRNMGTNCLVAWQGSNPRVKPKDSALWLYKTTWENPDPTDRVQSIDFISDGTVCAPFLVAITAE
jgi:hypothetical protein